MQPIQHKNFTPDEAVLAVALELSKGSWKIALHDGKRDKPAIHTVSDEEAPKRLAHAATVIEEMKRKWQLDQHIHVAVVYEAGQDAFWIGRALVDLGYEAWRPTRPASRWSATRGAPRPTGSTRSNW